MIDKIFNGLDIPYKETRFNKTPNTTYAVYSDSITRRGADKKNFWNNHHIFIELYSYTIDSESEIKIENRLNELNLEFQKNVHVWFEDEQRYQVIYDFNYIEK